MRKFNALQLKLLMTILMVLDHIKYFISPDLALIFHVITRCVAVWFGFMAVEGFAYTRNKVKYNARLFVWAGIMFAGNSLLNHLFIDNANVQIQNNIFLTLAAGVLILNILNKVKEDKTWIKVIKIILATAFTGLAVLYTEGGAVVIPFMLITYLFRDKTKVRNLCYVVLGILITAVNFQMYSNIGESIQMLLFNDNFMFLTVLPFIYMYNGERGPKTKFNKYFFYVFYPAHLWIITTMAYFLI